MFSARVPAFYSAQCFLSDESRHIWIVTLPTGSFFLHRIVSKVSINTPGTGYISLIPKECNFCFTFVQGWEFKNES